MTTLFVAGVSYNKEDGQCAHPSCKEKINWSKHDKPPPGWAHLVFKRYTKTGRTSHSTFVVCPQHTVGFGERNAPLFGSRLGSLVRTIIESPFAGNIEKNLAYLRAAMRDCLRRGEAPFASHGLYTQPGVTDDNVPEERNRGIEAGLAWSKVAQKVAVYTDLGISDGMTTGIAHHKETGIVIEHRKLSGWFEGRRRDSNGNEP